MRGTRERDWLGKEYYYFGPKGIAAYAPSVFRGKKTLLLLLLGPTEDPTRSKYYAVFADSPWSDGKTAFYALTPRELVAFLADLLQQGRTRDSGTDSGDRILNYRKE